MLTKTTKNMCKRRNTWSQARMRLYADDQLEITGELLNVFQQLKDQGECNIRSISAIERVRSGHAVVVKVVWEGLEGAESAWELVSRVFLVASAELRKEVKSFPLKAEI